MDTGPDMNIGNVEDTSTNPGTVDHTARPFRGESTTSRQLWSQSQRDERPSRTRSQPSCLTVRDFDHTLSYFTAKIEGTLPPGIPEVPLVIDNYETLVDESNLDNLEPNLDCPV